MFSLVAVLFLSLFGGGCPHQGSDHRLFGRIGCPLQRRLTIENARPPHTIWSFHLLKVSVKIDPKHPHLLVEWPTRSPQWWRFRVGYRWDANARAYIFPALALKKVDGPMPEYQKDAQHRLKATRGERVGGPAAGANVTLEGSSSDSLGQLSHLI
jgi:hypothetical protein